MSSITLAPYLIKVGQPYSKSDEYLHDFDGGNDLLTTLEDSLSVLGSAVNNDSAKRTISVRELSVGDRSIMGVIESGVYGAEGYLKDVDTGKKVHDKLKSHADMMPFYFLMSVPKGRTKGIVLMQRSGNDGVASSLHSLLASAFEKRHEDFRLRFSPFTTMGIIQAYLEKANINQIRLVRYTIPSDMSEMIGAGHRESEGTVEVRIKPKGLSQKTFKNRLKAAVKKEECTLGDVLDLEDPSFVPEVVKFEMTAGGKRRTLSFSNVLYSMRGEFDVTNEVSLGKDGHANIGSLDQVARGILADVERELYKKNKATK